MVINSADILKDQSGQIMERGINAHYLILGDDSENDKNAKVIEIGEGEGSPMGAVFSCPYETLEQLKHVGNLYRMIWNI